MKRHRIAKNLLTFIMAVACITVLTIGSNAFTMTVGGGGSSNPKYYGGTSTLSNNRFHTYLSSVGFNGLPSNTWPVGKEICFGYYDASGNSHSQVTHHTSSYSTSASVSVDNSVPVKKGGYTTYSANCTVGVSFYNS